MVAGWGGGRGALPAPALAKLWVCSCALAPAIRLACNGLVGLQLCSFSGLENSAGVRHLPQFSVPLGGDPKDSVAPRGEGGGEIGPWVCEGHQMNGHHTQKGAGSIAHWGFLSQWAPWGGGGCVKLYAFARWGKAVSPRSTVSRCQHSL